MYEYCGSLENAANLRYLHLVIVEEDSEGITSQFIPSKSAPSLTKLTILASSTDIDNFDDDFNHTLFQPFENLTELWVLGNQTLRCVTTQKIHSDHPQFSPSFGGME